MRKQIRHCKKRRLNWVLLADRKVITPALNCTNVGQYIRLSARAGWLQKLIESLIFAAVFDMDFYQCELADFCFRKK